MKITIGIIIGIVLATSLGAFAYTEVTQVGINKVNEFNLHDGLIEKLYDSDNGAVCYVYYGTGISCFKN